MLICCQLLRACTCSRRTTVITELSSSYILIFTRFSLHHPEEHLYEMAEIHLFLFHASLFHSVNYFKLFCQFNYAKRLELDLVILTSFWSVFFNRPTAK